MYYTIPTMELCQIEKVTCDQQMAIVTISTHNRQFELIARAKHAAKLESQVGSQSDLFSLGILLDWVSIPMTALAQVVSFNKARFNAQLNSNI